jgi:hypothetical protein
MNNTIGGGNTMGVGITAPGSSNLNSSSGVSGVVKENTQKDLQDRLNQIKARLGEMKKK